MALKVIPFFIFLSFLFPIRTHAGRKSAYLVKVAIKKNASRVRITSKGRLRMVGPHNEQITRSPLNISMRYSKLTVNGKRQESDSIAFISKNDHLYVDGKGYRGSIEIKKVGKYKFIVINEIDIEDYVKGVISNEISHKWKMEALKTQAIIARTYALYQKAQKKNEVYHLEATVQDQVYGGSDSETDRGNRAVNATRRMVVTFDNELALTVYHSTCGGYTEDAGNVWVGRAASYLEGVKCDFDRESPNFNWEAKIPLEEIRKALAKEGIVIGRIKEIDPLILTKSDRIYRLGIKHANGTEIIAGTDFRRAVGYGLVKSVLFTIKINNGFAMLNGKGSGHGAGLCQWGIKGMAKKGYNYKQILTHYYPGVKVKKY